MLENTKKFLYFSMSADDFSEEKKFSSVFLMVCNGFLTFLKFFKKQILTFLIFINGSLQLQLLFNNF